MKNFKKMQKMVKQPKPLACCWFSLGTVPIPGSSNLDLMAHKSLSLHGNMPHLYKSCQFFIDELANFAAV